MLLTVLHTKIGHINIWLYYVRVSFRIFQFIVIHTVKGYGIVKKAEIEVFLELSCFFDDPVDVGNLISGPSAFSKTSLNIWKFMVHVLLKPGLENVEHYCTSVRGNEKAARPAVGDTGQELWLKTCRSQLHPEKGVAFDCT